MKMILMEKTSDEKQHTFSKIFALVNENYGNKKQRDLRRK